LHDGSIWGIFRKFPGVLDLFPAQGAERMGRPGIRYRFGIAAVLVAAAAAGAWMARGLGGEEEEKPFRGEALFQSLCRRCHEAEPMVRALRRMESRERVTETIRGMEKFCGTGSLPDSVVSALADYLTAPVPEAPPALPENLKQGKALFQARCGKCHADLPARIRRARKALRSAAGWELLVKQERVRDPRVFSPDEGVEIVRYLEWAFPPPTAEGERRFLEIEIASRCRRCHAFSLRDTQPRTARDWDLTVEIMRRLDPFFIPLDRSKKYATYFRKHFLWVPENEEEKRAARLRLLFREKCSLCHSLTLARAQSEYFETWEKEVERMRLKSPSFYTREEGEAIARFLVEESK
jgi:mono/diheme cytochrome c family protein